MSATPAWRCPLDQCDGTGLLYDEDTNTNTDCACRPQMIAARKARSLSAQIPSRYRDVAFDRFPVTEIAPNVVKVVRAYTDSIDARLDAGDGLWFMGPVGTGKTTLAMLVSKMALQHGRTVARYSIPGLLNHIKSTFDTTPGAHDSLMDSLCTVDLLHLDDVGAERVTPWVLEVLYAIINTRYEEQKAIVLTTNLTDRGELCEQITERTVSRLSQMCQELPLLGPDHRLDQFDAS